MCTLLLALVYLMTVGPGDLLLRGLSMSRDLPGTGQQEVPVRFVRSQRPRTATHSLSAAGPPWKESDSLDRTCPITADDTDDDDSASEGLGGRL